MPQTGKSTTICTLELPGELEARGTDPSPGDERKRFFAVRKNGRYYAYRNNCPHAGAPLNWNTNQFLTYDNQFLLCSLHGAIFEIETGHCVDGPCKGERLTPAPFEIVDGRIVINRE